MNRRQRSVIAFLVALVLLVSAWFAFRTYSYWLFWQLVPRWESDDSSMNRGHRGSRPTDWPEREKLAAQCGRIARLRDIEASLSKAGFGDFVIGNRSVKTVVAWEAGDPFDVKFEGRGRAGFVRYVFDCNQERVKKLSLDRGKITYDEPLQRPPSVATATAFMKAIGIDSASWTYLPPRKPPSRGEPACDRNPDECVDPGSVFALPPGPDRCRLQWTRTKSGALEERAPIELAFDAQGRLCRYEVYSDGWFSSRDLPEPPARMISKERARKISRWMLIAERQTARGLFPPNPLDPYWTELVIVEPQWARKGGETLRERFAWRTDFRFRCAGLPACAPDGRSVFLDAETGRLIKSPQPFFYAAAECVPKD